MTGHREVTGLNPVEALIFFRLLLSNCLNWKSTVMITLHFHLQLQYKYELFHVNFTLCCPMLCYVVLLCYVKPCLQGGRVTLLPG